MNVRLASLTFYTKLTAALLALAAAASTAAAAAPEAQVDAPPYRIEDVALPVGMSPEASAAAFSPSGRLYVATRHGEVWSLDTASSTWRQFAHGLHEPLGLVALSDTEIYVSHKPELTRLRDTDGDGAADDYESVGDAWVSTDNWHEHAFGLHRDAAGNFVVALGLCDTAGPINVLRPRRPLDFSRVADEAKLSLGPYQGWVLKISPAGEVTPWASGFREPCGVGISPDDDVFITDQQGDYIGSSGLVHVERGKFYGHPASIKWEPGFAADKKPTLDQLAARRTPPAVILPHGSMGGSPGEPVWDRTAGRFGPFAGQVLIGDFTKLISRVDLERVAGEWQGACFPFLRDALDPEAIAKNSGKSALSMPAGAEGKKYFRNAARLAGTPLGQGSMRMAFAPDGSLYVAQTTRGWGSGDGLQRIVWTGRTPVEVHTMRLTPTGFRLRFTTPMNEATLAEPARYRVTRFRYVYHQHYGSPRIDENPVAVTAVRVASSASAPSSNEAPIGTVPSGTTISSSTVEVDLEQLDPGFVYLLELDGLTSADGRPVGYPEAYYTLNRTLDGRRYEGAITDGLASVKAAEPPRPGDVKLGARVYTTFCAQCHRIDGKGGGLPGVGAADFTRTGGPLTKPDDELLRRIGEGIPGKTMPPFGYVLSQQQIVDVLAFIRTKFAPTTTTAPTSSRPSSQLTSPSSPKPTSRPTPKTKDLQP
jgi:mono/diheme cytochrome c family protein/glucose/arabinose dehydrogenase